MLCGPCCPGTLPFLANHNCFYPVARATPGSGFFDAQRFDTYNRPRRIDSHSHYHMLPVVFDALMDVIQEENLSVSYIRIPEEYVKIYFSCRKELVQFLPINLLKVLVLNLLAKRNKRKYRKFLESLEQSVFCGVMYSGRMCSQNMGVLLPEMEHLAKRCGKNLEVLAHPGGVYEQEDIGLLTNEGDVAFLTSDLRQAEAEAEAFISLKSHTDGKSPQPKTFVSNYYLLTMVPETGLRSCFGSLRQRMTGSVTYRFPEILARKLRCMPDFGMPRETLLC